MPKYAKTDDNHALIVSALRRVGAQVASLASIGRGMPDLLVAFRGKWHVAEVKSGKKFYKGHKELSPQEEVWHETFGQQARVQIWHDVEEAMKGIGAM